MSGLVVAVEQHCTTCKGEGKGTSATSNMRAPGQNAGRHRHCQPPHMASVGASAEGQGQAGARPCVAGCKEHSCADGEHA